MTRYSENLFNGINLDYMKKYALRLYTEECIARACACYAKCGNDFVAELMKDVGGIDYDENKKNHPSLHSMCRNIEKLDPPMEVVPLFDVKQQTHENLPHIYAKNGKIRKDLKGLTLSKKSYHQTKSVIESATFPRTHHFPHYINSQIITVVVTTPDDAAEYDMRQLRYKDAIQTHKENLGATSERVKCKQFIEFQVTGNDPLHWKACAGIVDPESKEIEWKTSIWDESLSYGENGKFRRETEAPPDLDIQPNAEFLRLVRESPPIILDREQNDIRVAKVESIRAKRESSIEELKAVKQNEHHNRQKIDKLIAQTSKYDKQDKILGKNFEARKKLPSAVDELLERLQSQWTTVKPSLVDFFSIHGHLVLAQNNNLHRLFLSHFRFLYEYKEYFSLVNPNNPEFCDMVAFFEAGQFNFKVSEDDNIDAAMRDIGKYFEKYGEIPNERKASLSRPNNNVFVSSMQLVTYRRHLLSDQQINKLIEFKADGLVVSGRTTMAPKFKNKENKKRSIQSVSPVQATPSSKLNVKSQAAPKKAKRRTKLSSKNSPVAISKAVSTPSVAEMEQKIKKQASLIAELTSKSQRQEKRIEEQAKEIFDLEEQLEAMKYDLDGAKIDLADTEEGLKTAEEDWQYEKKKAATAKNELVQTMERLDYAEAVARQRGMLLKKEDNDIDCAKFRKLFHGID